MALTDNCDVFGSVHEDGLNLVGRHLMLQRPSLFNYGTQLFASNPALLCKRIETHPEVARRGNPLITLEKPLPILGTDGLLGLHFCFQITQLRVDLHPGNQFSLPPQLGPSLREQRMAFHIEVCAGIACPDPEVADQYGDTFDHPPIRLPGQQHDDRREKEEEEPIQPIPARRVGCFCLALFGVAHVEIIRASSGDQLTLRLDGLEIVDIRPEGLENNLECYLSTTLRVGILPRVRVALDTMVFKLDEFATLSISPTAISASVPNNPAIEEDQIRVFVDVGASP